MTAFSVTVKAYLSSGSVATGYNAPCVLTLSSSTSGGTLSGTTTVQFVNGVATFTGLQVSTGGTYVLKFTSGNLVTTFSITFSNRQT
jgi:hypothetical protein